MNYQLYVIAAYSVAFIIIGIMFTGSYRRYRRVKQKFEDSRKKGS